MFFLPNIVGVIFSMCVFFSIKSYKISIAKIALIEFDIAYVLPMLVESIVGPAQFSYYGFKLSLFDEKTMWFYLLFVLVVQILFWLYIKKTDSIKIKKENTLIHNIKNGRIILYKKKWIKYISIIMMLLLYVLWLFSPDPIIYLKKIGAFIFYNLDDKLVNYNNTFIKYGVYIGFAGIILNKVIDIKDNKFMACFRWMTIALVTLLDGKRTLLAFVVIILLVIDFFSSKKKSKVITETIIGVGIVGLYFYIYAQITGKVNYSPSNYLMISEYFFRSNSVKVALYSLLNPGKLKILDYPCQTMMYNLFFFIPRRVWLSKPYAYPDYYSSAVNGFRKFTYIGWDFQTDIYAEFISNFSYIGIIIAPIFILWVCRKIDKSNGMIVKVLGMFIIVILQVFEYNDMTKIIMILWIAMLIKEKIIKRHIVFKLN